MKTDNGHIIVQTSKNVFKQYKIEEYIPLYINDLINDKIKKYLPFLIVRYTDGNTYFEVADTCIRENDDYVRMINAISSLTKRYNRHERDETYRHVYKIYLSF